MPLLSKSFHWIAILSVVAALPILEAMAEEPMGMHAPIATTSVYRADAAQFWRQFYVDRYLTTRLVDDDRHAAAMALFEAAASASIDGPAALENRLKLGARALAAGADHPMVHCVYGLALAEAGRSAEAVLQLELASPPTPNAWGGWFDCMVAVSKSELYERLSNSDRANALRETLGEKLLRALDDGSIPHPSARHILNWLGGGLSRFPVRHQLQLADEILRIPNADPWLAKTLAGAAHLQIVRDQTGRLQAAKPAAGGMGYQIHIAAARLCLTEAYELDKSYPEPAALMIEVAALQSTNGETPRQWFDRATAAQIDFDPAFSNYMNALRPFHTGSIEALLEFGLECARSNRHDTTTPMRLAEALHMISEDGQGDLAVYNRPEVFPELLRVHSGRQEILKSDNRVHELEKSWTVAFDVACRLERWDDARQMLNCMEGGLALRLKSRLADDASKSARATINALTGPFQERLDEVRRLETKEKNYAGAIAIMESILKDSADAGSREVLESRLRWLRLQSDYAAGNQVLLPAAGKMSGWKIARGDFLSGADGSTLIHSSANGAMAFCPLQLGPRFELELTADTARQPNNNWRCAAVFLGDAEQPESKWCAFHWQPADKFVDFRRFDRTNEVSRHRCSSDMPGQFRLRVWDGRMTAYVQRQVILGDHPIELGVNEATVVGLGSLAAIPDIQTVIESASVRKLTDNPEYDAIRFSRLMRESYRLADDGHLNRAIDLLASAGPFRDPEYFQVAHSFVRRSLENRRGIALQQPIDLLALAADSKYWREQGNVWNVEGDRLVGTTIVGAIRRTFALDVADFKFSYRVVWDKNSKPEFMLETTLGVRAPDQHWISILRQPNGEICYHLHYPSSREYARPRHRVNRESMNLAVVKKGQTMELFHDGDLIAREQYSRPGYPFGCIGFAVHSTRKGEVVAITNMQLTPLSFE